MKIGLAVMSTLNYGNQIVNIALCNVLKKFGHRVSLIFPPKDTENDLCQPLCLYREFPLEEGELIVPETYKDLISLNDQFDLFVTGGDQLFRFCFMEKMRDFAYLDWVKEEKKKICIATSFGLDKYEITYPYVIGKGKYWFEQFYGLSIREQSGIELLHQLFGVENSVELMLDPVLLCDQNSLDEIGRAYKNRGDADKYVGAYFLDPNQEKEKIINEISASLCNGKKKVVLDADLQEKNTAMPHMEAATVEDLLTVVKNSEFILTDSFHGTCLAIIYHKNFGVLFTKDNWRGLTRIQSLLKMVGLEEHLVSSYSDFLDKHALTKEIDYNTVDQILSDKRNEGKQWIWNQLCHCRKNDVSDFTEIYQDTHLKFQDFPDNVQYVSWGGGQFLHQFYDILIEKNVKYVCDKRKELWGVEVLPGITGVDENELLQMPNIVIIVTIDSWDATVEIMKKVQNLQNVKGVIHILEIVK